MYCSVCIVEAFREADLDFLEFLREKKGEPPMSSRPYMYSNLPVKSTVDLTGHDPKILISVDLTGR